MKVELNDYKDVVQRVRFIIKESQAKYTDQTPISEIKEAFIEQAVANGQKREDAEKNIQATLNQAETDPVVKKGLISYLNTEFERSKKTTQ